MAARHRDQVGGIDLALALVEPLAERHHAAGHDADVALHYVGRRGDGGVADHEIVVGHVSSPEGTTGASPVLPIRLDRESGAVHTPFKEKGIRMKSSYRLGVALVAAAFALPA